MCQFDSKVYRKKEIKRKHEKEDDIGLLGGVVFDFNLTERIDKFCHDSPTTCRPRSILFYEK